MPLYRLVRAVIRAALNVFFREIHLVGLEHVPVDRPVIFAGNHPNSLIDPALVVATSGRIVHFAAKDKLFAPPFGLVLKSLGAVPIARAMDHGQGGARDNSNALVALQHVLAEGRCTGIFPEGLSHTEAQLQRVRTGAARIALQTLTDHPDCGLVVVPVGLTYMHRKSFRSQVLVQYGPPIDLDPSWVERFAADSRAAAAALTDDIEAGMRALTVNAPDWETLRVLDGVRRLYQPKNISMVDRVELARRFCSAHEDLKDEPRVAALMEHVRAYLDELDALGLEDRDLIRGLSPGRALANLLRLAVWLPIALPGLPVHAPLYLAIDYSGRRFAPRKDVVGTSRLMLGLLAVLALYLAIPVAIGVTLGPAAGVGALFALLGSGFAALVVLERTNSLRRMGTSAVASLTLQARVSELRRRRAELEAEVVQLVYELKPPDMVLLFDRGGDPVAGP